MINIYRTCVFFNFPVFYKENTFKIYPLIYIAKNNNFSLNQNIRHWVKHGMEWKGLEWNGMEWNGMDWIGMEWNGIEFFSMMSS